MVCRRPERGVPWGVDGLSQTYRMVTMVCGQSVTDVQEGAPLLRRIVAIDENQHLASLLFILTKAPHLIRIHLLLHDAFFDSLQAEVWMLFDLVAPKSNHRPPEFI